MLPKKLSERQARKIVYIPEKLRGIYKWQEEVTEIDRVTDIKKYHQKKRRFLNSETGKKFLKYKVRKVGKLHGIDLWLVDGNALRSGKCHGDVDFTQASHAYRRIYVPTHEIWIDKLQYRTKDYWPTVWHEYIERILMRNGLPYGEAHRMASRLEIVLRDGKYFILPVGTHRQSRPGLCGPAALKIVTDYLRYPVSESYLTRLCKTTPKKGTDPSAMVAAAKKLGFVARDKQFLTTAQVKRLIFKGIPVIANYQLSPDFGEGHYAVIVGYSKDSYILSNPGIDRGYEVVKIKDFHKLWYELEDKTRRQGIIVKNVE